MSNVTNKLENNILTIYLKNRLDSTNSESTESDINNILESSKFDDLIIDLSDLEYISSAGLRLILRLKKNYKSLKVINASSEVYEIFDMTGFTEMIDIHKAYKNVSIEGCEVVGRGANGLVYKLDNERIVKVYVRGADVIKEIEKERELARKAFVLEIPTAISYDIVKVGDYYGSVFELLEAKSFVKLLNSEIENFDKYVKMYADLGLKLHETMVKPNELPKMKEIALGWLPNLKSKLDATSYSKFEKLLNEINDDPYMLHGDFHIKNVMLQKGEILLIDMDTLCTGNKIFEFAFMYNAYKGFSLLDHNNIKEFLGIDYDLADKFFRKTISYYFKNDDDKFIDDIIKKSSILGNARILNRMIKHKIDTKEEVDAYVNEIQKCLNEVDNLNL